MLGIARSLIRPMVSICFAKPDREEVGGFNKSKQNKKFIALWRIRKSGGESVPSRSF